MVAAIVALFMLPVRAVYDVGSQFAPISSLYAPERSGSISYAYSQGQSLVLAPMVGAGMYGVLVRMGGPGGHDPLPARVEIGGYSAAIGDVGSIRVFVSWRLPMPTARWQCV